MKNYEIRIQPFSALAGACLLALCFVATGAFAPQGSASARDVSAIEIVSTNPPEDYVRIYDATPYTVPSAKRLIITALGNPNLGITYTNLYIDGNLEVTAHAHPSFGYGNGHGWGATILSSVTELPTPGIAAISGQLVTVNAGVAWGYLVDA